MQPVATDAADQPPAPSQAFNNGRPMNLSKNGPESVSRSEAAISVDLSAASNMAAHGEEPSEMAQYAGSIMSGLEKNQTRTRSSDAEKWFQDSNKNASTRGNVSFFDDDPPFHIHQRPAELTARHLPVRTASDIPAFDLPSLRHLQSIQSSSSGEFRAVIDDLTIENKQLKKRLRLCERSYATHLHPDRMFEVRMPGLAGKEKQRLERLLKDFAESISGSETGRQTAKAARKRSKLGSGSNKPSSSSTLDSRSSNLIDSAYASASTSAGNASGSQQGSRALTSESMARNPFRNEPGHKDQKVRSYLQNISHGLLPQRPTVMTEKARKREVAKRLEQLFTGRAITNAKNSQTAQQQEVSTAAANADVKANEARGRPPQAEGSREANILHAEAEAAMLQNDSSASKQKGQTSPAEDVSQVAPDQRPTRPLDLDLNRAQVAADNIAYIQHLGFRPRAASEANKYADDGWVYLNLLMGMAQLHTANVTPDFVRQALAEVSDKFEVSSDGSKIRWKGGSEGTRMSGDSGSSAGSKDSSPADREANGAGIQRPSSRSSKPAGSDQTTAPMTSSGNVDGPSRPKTISRGLSSSTDATPSGFQPSRIRPTFLGHIAREHSFQYEPMFLHGSGSDDEGDYYLNENDSLLSSGLREDLTGSGESSQRAKKPKLAPARREDGPMIFYHRAKFVTDLSGDKGFVPVNNTAYFRASPDILGSTALPDIPSGAEKKGIMSASSPQVVTAMSYFPQDDLPDPEFYDGSPPTSAGLEQPTAFPMPVCGLAGVYPMDNHVFYPTHRQLVRERQKPFSTKVTKHLRTKLHIGDTDLFERVSAQNRLEVRLEGVGPVKHTELKPSDLPPPSYVQIPSNSSQEDDEWDSDDDEEGDGELSGDASGVNQIPDFAPPALMLTHEETTTITSGSEVSTDDDAMDEDDDDEIDLLAHERALNAEEVAMREREFEENFREPSPDAKSSQATVGDRSFLSDEEEDLYRNPIRSDRKRSTRAGSKRGIEELEDEGAVPASPAKRVETLKTKSGRKVK